MSDLITTSDITARLDDLDAVQTAALSGLITAASRQIERYCGQRFNSADHDEIAAVRSSGTLFLQWYPVIQIDRLMGDWTEVLSVENTSGSVTRANVRLRMASDIEDAPGPLFDQMVLTRWVSGAASASTLTLATYPMLSDLVTAINALGNGWTASAESGYESWPTQDLYCPAPLRAKSQAAKLVMATRDVDESGMTVDPSTGIIRGLACCQSLRARYKAGYATVPEDIQEACVLAVSAMLLGPESMQTIGVGITERSLGDRTVKWGDAASMVPGWLTPQVKQLLGPYMRRGAKAI